MIINILLALAAIVVLFVLVVATRPNDFRISRSIDIAAPVAAAFDQVNDLHRWQQMSPYAKLDTAAKYTFEGPATGPGASVFWAGNNKIGEGRLTIIESKSNKMVRMKLEFIRPFQVTNTAEFSFAEGARGTKATWSLFGQSRFMCKAIGLFVNMDKMCGDQFTEGLTNMKAIAEGNRPTSSTRLAETPVISSQGGVALAH